MNRFIASISLLFPILASAQTVDFERDSLLVELPYANVLQVLASQVPGFYISPADNSAGDMSATMTLRGMNVVSSDKSSKNLSLNAPAIIVDGLLFTGSINEISTIDIEKVEVIKGASASVLYGTRAGNGAIVITTRKGKTGKPVMRLDAGGSVSDWSHRPDGVNDEWTDYISRKGIGQQYALSVSGVDKGMNYYVSGNYIRQQGILLGDDARMMNVLAKVESRPVDWILIGVKGSYSGTLTWGVTPRLQAAFWMNEPAEKFSTVPEYEYWHSSMPDGVTRNPLAGIRVDESYLYTDKETTDSRMDGMAWLCLDLPFLPGLSLESIFHSRRGSEATDSFTKPEFFVDTRIADDMANPYKFNMQASGYANGLMDKSWQLKNSVSHENTFGKHCLKVCGSAERESLDSDWLKVLCSGFDTPTNLGIYTLKTALNYSMGRGMSFRDYESYVVGIDYSFARNLNFSAGWRMDELIYKDKLRRVYNSFKNSYYDFSLAWSALENRLLLHASYGGSGADESAIKQGMTAADKVVVGLDYRTRNDLLRGSVDVYRNYYNGFYRHSLFNLYGLKEIAVSNTGVELNLRSINLNGNGNDRIKWESALLISVNRNRIDMLFGKKKYNIDLLNALTYGYDLYYALGTGKPISGIFANEYVDNPTYLGDQDPQIVVNVGNTVAWKKVSLWFNLRGAYGSEGHFLGYDTVGQEWVSRNYMKLSDLVLSCYIHKGITVYLSGTNLFTYTKWPALDPENGGTIAASFVSDSYQSYPTFRTLRLGITSSF